MARKLSSKAAALLADLKANAPEQESKYIGGLVENAEKRRRTAELAWEKKLAREEDEHGAPRMKFVTSAYEERIRSAAADGDGEVSFAEQFLLRGAEKIEETNHQTQRRLAAKQTRAAPTTTVAASELLRRRDERRASRLAPESKLTEEMIEDARQKAFIRLGRSIAST